MLVIFSASRAIDVVAEIGQTSKGPVTVNLTGCAKDHSIRLVLCPICYTEMPHFCPQTPKQHFFVFIVKHADLQRNIDMGGWGNFSVFTYGQWHL